MSLRDEFIDKLAQEMHNASLEHGTRPTRAKEEWAMMPKSEKQFWYNDVEVLLSLQVKGHRLLIGKVGAELPRNPCVTNYRVYYDQGQQSMLKEGWVKEVRGDG